MVPSKPHGHKQTRNASMNQRTRNVIGSASMFFVDPPKQQQQQQQQQRSVDSQKSTTTAAISPHKKLKSTSTFHLPATKTNRRRARRPRPSVDEQPQATSTLLRSPRGLSVSKELSHLLRSWDNGTTSNRRSILKRFVSEHLSETASEIEASYANGGSLLLSRLISSMRVTRISTPDTVLHFKAIQVFLSSSSCAPYLTEYLEAGGIAVTLSSLNSVISPSNPELPRAKYLPASSVELCRSAFELLRLVAVAGRPYKELLCECDALVQVTSVMRGSMNSAVNHDGRTLLLELGSGNPRFEDTVLYTILQMLPCPNPVCQRMAAQMTRAFMSTVSFHSSRSGNDAAFSFVPAAVSMTRSVDLQVQYEAVELLSVLSRDCPATIPAIIAGLLPLARNPVIEQDVCSPLDQSANDGGDGGATLAGEDDEKNSGKRAPPTADELEAQTQNYHQITAAANLWQASATRALEALVAIEGASRAIVRHGGVYVLLGALLNESNVDARDVALEALLALCESGEEVDAAHTGATVKRNTAGNITRLAVTHVLGDQQWARLRSLSTTVGYTIDDLNGCKNRINESTGGAATTTVNITRSDVKAIVQNLYACRIVTSHLATKVVRDNDANRTKRRALGLHLGPETSIEEDDNEYKDLMERLIRSSLPEIMDRDFTASAEEALTKRNKER